MRASSRRGARIPLSRAVGKAAQSVSRPWTGLGSVGVESVFGLPAEAGAWQFGWGRRRAGARLFWLGMWRSLVSDACLGDTRSPIQIAIPTLASDAFPVGEVVARGVTSRRQYRLGCETRKRCDFRRQRCAAVVCKTKLLNVWRANLLLDLW
jgi:hypothetical protein